MMLVRIDKRYKHFGTARNDCGSRSSCYAVCGNREFKTAERKIPAKNKQPVKEKIHYKRNCRCSHGQMNVLGAAERKLICKTYCHERITKPRNAEIFCTDCYNCRIIRIPADYRRRHYERACHEYERNYDGRRKSHAERMLNSVNVFFAPELRDKNRAAA